jgi:hypothetical protein
MLADAQKDDMFRHRLSLLCRCYGTLSPNAELSLAAVMKPALKAMKMIGFKAADRRPDRWRRWLADVGSLIALPIAEA